jgi:hypothetical protein
MGSSFPTFFPSSHAVLYSNPVNCENCKALVLVFAKNAIASK